MTDTTKRNDGLRAMLSQHRREMQDDVQRRIRYGRTGRTSDVGDDFEASDGEEGHGRRLLQGRAGLTLVPEAIRA
jgi:hypothetical protein